VTKATATDQKDPCESKRAAALDFYLVRVNLALMGGIAAADPSLRKP
jgi:hypothetical protein